jgi:hypothetical protein
MPRRVRIEFEGARYVMCRGDRGEAIFRDDRDREGFLETLGELCAKCGFRFTATCSLITIIICLWRCRRRTLWRVRNGSRDSGHAKEAGVLRRDGASFSRRTSRRELFRCGLQAPGMTCQMPQLCRNDRRKQALASLVKTQTMVGDDWIRQNLDMGDRSNVSPGDQRFSTGKTSHKFES